MASTLTASVRAVPQLNAIGIVCSDMRRSTAFYGLLGIEFPEGNGHVEATLPNGVRLMLDGEEVVRSFRSDWTRATGNQLALADYPRYLGIDRSPTAVRRCIARVRGEPTKSFLR